MSDHPGSDSEMMGGAVASFDLPSFLPFPPACPGVEAFEFIGQGGNGGRLPGPPDFPRPDRRREAARGPARRRPARFHRPVRDGGPRHGAARAPNVRRVHDYGSWRASRIWSWSSSRARISPPASRPAAPFRPRRRDASPSPWPSSSLRPRIGCRAPDIKKPSNILLAATGRVRIADFGLAKIDDRTRRASAHALEHLDGQLGLRRPEVICRPSEADARADVYSLGVVLYEM